MRAVGTQLSSFSDGRCKTLEDFYSAFPVDASVCDADTLLESDWSFGRYFLVALVDIRLNHNTNDRSLASTKLVANNLCYLGLISVVLVRVAWNVSVGKYLRGAGKTCRASNRP